MCSRQQLKHAAAPDHEDLVQIDKCASARTTGSALPIRSPSFDCSIASPTAAIEVVDEVASFGVGEHAGGRGLTLEQITDELLNGQP